jgi:hypothetical protein
MRFKSFWLRAVALGALSALAGCGGSGGVDGTNAPGSGANTAPNAAPNAAPTKALTASISFAQTHVIPAAGLSWMLGTNTTKLELVGGKATLALVKIAEGDAVAPVIEATGPAGSLGTVTLAAPAALPKTEASGAAFAADQWSADLPASWIVPGVSLSVKASNYAASQAVTPLVGADSRLGMTLLPFYLFGATEAQTQPRSVTQTIDAATTAELLAKWPIAAIDVKTHSAGAVALDRLAIAPRAGGSAYVVTSAEQQKDGYAVMSSVLRLIARMREANGEGAQAVQYYAPILAINTTTGRYADPGGGLGGGSVGTGDYRYAGVFYHEQGHAFGLPHAGEAFTDGKFPYTGGSVTGSVWGYDAARREFLSPLIPSTASSFANCARNHQVNTAGACFKQDPMQSGSGDQAPGQKFTMLSDFNAGQIVNWFQGITTISKSGAHLLDGKLFAEGPGYKQWDTIDRRWVMLSGDQTQENALYGVNQNLPVQQNVPVYAIAVTLSNATPGVSMIYSPIRFTGNLIRTFDPTSAADRTDFTPGSGKYQWYCQSVGCDYTVRVTYSDGSVIHRALQGAFREWFKPTSAPSAQFSDPLDGDSFRNWVINVPGTKTISRVELLSTPMVWTGMPSNPTVVLSR